MPVMRPFFLGDTAYKLRAYNHAAVEQWLSISGPQRESLRRTLYRTPNAPILPADCMFESFAVNQHLCYADVTDPGLFLADCLVTGDGKDFHCLIFFRVDSGRIADVLQLPLFPPAPLPAPPGVELPPMPPSRFPLDRLLLEPAPISGGDETAIRSQNIASITQWFSFCGQERHAERLQYFTRDNPEYAETQAHAAACRLHPEDNVFPDWGFYTHSLFACLEDPNRFLGEGLGQGALHNHPMMPDQATLEAHYLFPFVMRDGMICDFTEMHIDTLPMVLTKGLLRA